MKEQNKIIGNPGEGKQIPRLLKQAGEDSIVKEVLAGDVIEVPEGIEKIILYNGEWGESFWCGYRNGAITRGKNTEYTAHTIDGRHVELCRKLFPSTDNRKGYGNGLIIRDRGTFTAYRDDETQGRLYNGIFHDDWSWQGYGNGMIIRQEGVFIAMREDKKPICLYSKIHGEFDVNKDSWLGYGNGLLIIKDHVITAYPEEGDPIKLYEGDMHVTLGGYGKGVIVQVESKVTAYDEDGKETLLFDGGKEFWDDTWIGTNRFDIQGFKDGLIVRRGKVFTACRPKEK